VPLWRIITGLGITQIIGWGTTYYALGALSGDIEAATGWPKTLVFGAFSAALLLSGLISRYAGRLIDRQGGRRMMSLGSLAAAVGCLLLGSFATPLAYVAGWLILGIAMRLATYDAAFASLAQIVPGNTRRAISYLSLFGGLASTVFWPVGHWLSLRFGWQATFLIYAGLHLLVCLPIHRHVLAEEPHARGTADDDAPPDDGPRLEGGARIEAMALLAAALALNGIVFAAISAHVIPLFEGLGFAGGTAVTLAALIGPSQVASRLGDILMGRHITPLQLGLLAFGLLPLALAAFAAGGFSWPAALLFALLYGASNGLVTIAKGAVSLALFGRRGYGELLGTITIPSLFLNAVAPTLFALLLDRSSAATGLLVALVFGLLSAAAMAALARRHQH
jgi:MFS family permease